MQMMKNTVAPLKIEAESRNGTQNQLQRPIMCLNDQTMQNYTNLPQGSTQPSSAFANGLTVHTATQTLVIHPLIWS